MAGSIWNPLNPQSRHIRLLTLHDGKWDDPISCSLEQADLDGKPHYCTLSYVWGSLTSPENPVKLGYYDPIKKVHVWDDDHEEKWITVNQLKIQVTLNLHKTLRRLRAAQCLAPIWIDAICINQSDVDERTHQVGLMRDIYQSASKAYISLGEGHSSPIRLTSSFVFHGNNENPIIWHGQSNRPVVWHGDDRDLLFLKYFHAIITHSSGIYSYTYGTDHETDELLHTYCILRLLAEDCHFGNIPYLGRQTRSSWITPISRVFLHLMYNEWFHRIWTVQEAVLSTNCVVLHGHMVAPWSIFSDATANFLRHQSSCCGGFDLGSMNYYLSCFADVIQPIQNLRRLLPSQESQARMSLPLLLWRFRNRRATDHRDKVFALLGMVTDWEGREPIRADYRLNVQELYRTVVLNTMEQTQSLSILEGDLKSTDKQQRHLRLPSWVPDWSDPMHSVLFQQEHDRSLRGSLFNASRGANYDARLEEPNILRVSARIFDTVESVSGKLSPAQGGRWHALRIPVRPPKLFFKLQTDPYTRSVITIQRQWRRRKEVQISVWKTLCADSVGNSASDDPQRPLYRRLNDDDNNDILQWGYLRFTRAALPVHVAGAWWEPAAYPNDRVYALDKSSVAAVENSCFFVTRSRLLVGVGPRTTVEGDVVAVLHGGRMPFVMRKVEVKLNAESPTRTTYELIGACYVHGMMDGQAVTGPDAVYPQSVFLG